MKHEVFNSEFERRLFALRDVINYYERTRNTSNVLPSLNSCLRYCWCNDPSIRVSDRVFRSKLSKISDAKYFDYETYSNEVQQ